MAETKNKTTQVGVRFNKKLVKAMGKLGFESYQSILNELERAYIENPTPKPPSSGVEGQMWIRAKLQSAWTVFREQ